MIFDTDKFTLPEIHIGFFFYFTQMNLCTVYSHVIEAGIQIETLQRIALEKNIL